MSSSSSALPNPQDNPKANWTWPAQPFKNPSYPDRIYFAERPALEALLKSCDEKVAAAGKKLAVLGNHPRREEYEIVHQQMRGARDQVAQAVYRMPRESGELYRDDRERLAVAEKAFSWLAARWDAIGS